MFTFGKSGLRLAALVAFAMPVAIGAAVSHEASAKKVNWNNTVAQTNGGHLIGNPEAEAALAEFVSYTCPHCATFAANGDPALKLVYIQSGRLSLEIRHVIRDPIDWTAAVLTNCGAPAKFARNHSLFMQEQDKWLAKAKLASSAQQHRWSNTNRAAARRAIASDLGFYDLMTKRGYSRLETDKCLADNAAANLLVTQSITEAKRLGVTGTPSFALNDELLAGTHSWQPLRKQLDSFLLAKKGK